MLSSTTTVGLSKKILSKSDLEYFQQHPVHQRLLLPFLQDLSASVESKIEKTTAFIFYFKTLHSPLRLSSPRLSPNGWMTSW
jgi:hypothetical protein